MLPAFTTNSPSNTRTSGHPAVGSQRADTGDAAEGIGLTRPAAMLVTLIAAVAVLQGCATAPVARPPPVTHAEPTVVPGMPDDVRSWSDDPNGAFRDWLEQPAEQLVACCAGLMNRPHNYLAISSGGVDGAFGAGLLAGWTAAGTRPEFQLVTGVSAGAMIAPFAFLGSAYDGVLLEIYSAYSSKDLVERRSMLEALVGDAVMDTAPLRRLIDRYLGDEQVAQIAAEGRKGRKLLIGTTSLNSGRPVIWDLTKIAGCGAPNARQLIGDLVLASASIPGVFPPVRISVQTGGVRYDELHVDGGVTAQVFLGPAGLDWKRVIEQLHVQGQPQVYLIRNARSYPQWTAVRARLAPLLDRSVTSLNRNPDELPMWDATEPGVSSILARSMGSLIRTRGFYDAVSLYLSSQSNQLGFNLAHIPDDFAADSTELYDRNYMRGLFERGFAMAKQGYPWLHNEVAMHE